MKPTIRSLAFLAALASACASTQAAPPTAEAVETLLTLTQAEQNMNKMFDQLPSAMRAGVMNHLKTQTLSAAQEAVITKFTASYVKTVKEQNGWAFVKPTIVQIYRETFTDEEVNGQIAFYRSPAGEAAVRKMPVIVQKSALATQSHAKSLAPKINEGMKLLVKELADVK